MTLEELYMDAYDYRDYMEDQMLSNHFRDNARITNYVVIITREDKTISEYDIAEDLNEVADTIEDVLEIVADFLGIEVKGSPEVEDIVGKTMYLHLYE